MNLTTSPSSFLPILAVTCALYCCGWFMASLSALDTLSGAASVCASKQRRSSGGGKLCQSATEYATGRWVRNNASFPYISSNDDEWGPICTDIQKTYQSKGIIPDYLKYEWTPDGCSLLPFEREHFCRVFFNKTIGLIGDSMMQQFAHSFMGMLLGVMDDTRYLTPDWELVVPLCQHTKLRFVRWNKYLATEEDHAALDDIVQDSDFLVMNFGVHYQPWLEFENTTIDMVRHLETHNWLNKKLFWRSTLVAHANCSSAQAPDEQNKNETYSLHSWYNTDEILLQEKEIVLPLFQQSSLLNISLLNVATSTLVRRDGHRVIGRKNSEDCLHYCEPGPTDNWVRLFFHHVALDLES